MHQDILYSMDAEDKCTFTLKEMEYYACVTYKGIRNILEPKICMLDLELNRSLIYL